MESPGSYIGAIIGMIIVGCLFTVIGFDIHKDLTVIDTRVETVDGKTYDCTEANSSDNGMTYIRKPYYITMPSRNIKLIKRIK
jgi:NADH:ubiquinone oxidoreductase subunit 3 (subunit A)